ncbi:MAG: right-handed parallel beta-helix repeat-containing protein [Puniceicoccaceae bacterium]
MHGVQYYVSGNGDDDSNGLSPAKAFRNLQTAADLTKPGDTVFIMDGTFKEPDGAERVLVISRSGEKDKPVKYQAYPGHTPVIEFSLWAGIEVQDASHIEIQGLKVRGRADAITLEYAQQEMSNLGNPRTSGNGIFVRGDSASKSVAHNVSIIDNHVSKAPGGGIGAMHVDYLTIKGNVVEECGFYAPYANSGISVYQAVDIDDYTGYKIVIAGNVSRKNYNHIPFYFSNEDPEKRQFTDGNGIIVDDLKGSQDFVNPAMSKPFGGRTLIANNICYDNGGSGIHAFKCLNVDIVHNTAYLNGRHPEMDVGQIFANTSEQITIANNILYALPGKKINDNYKISEVQFLNNLYYDGSQSPNSLVQGENTVIENPAFIALPPAHNAFHPDVSGACIDNGIRLPLHDNEHMKLDASLSPRVVGGAPDIGAFESALPCQTEHCTSNHSNSIPAKNF